MTTRYRRVFAAVLCLCLFLGIGTSAQQLPSRLSDDTFWKMVTDFSEGGGEFVSDNFVSNERVYQYVIPDLVQGRQPAGAYIGVGPEQNFTYVVALQPKIAFIIDIRRQNMIQHLMYKALFELSADRAEFLSRLFSRPRPSNLDRDASLLALFEAFHPIEPETQMFFENLRVIKDGLIKGHGFALTPEDEASLEYVFSAFFIGGPGLAYSRTNPPGMMPSYEELMAQADEQGNRRSFLATEENFAWMRQFEMNNLLVPLVGDFGGFTAIRAVGQYLKDHDTNVTAFYTSNVEQYLFRSEDSWKRFYGSVSALPVDSQSVFIRAVIKTRGGQFSAAPFVRPGFSQLDTILYPIADLVTAFQSDMVRGYYDIVNQPAVQPNAVEQKRGE